MKKGIRSKIGGKKFKINARHINVLILFVIFVFSVSSIYGVTDPTLVNKLNTAFKKIQGYLLKLATPIAGVAIGSGVLIRKLSFGDEEKMVIGKKIIINAIVGYAIIISTDLIIRFVDTILK